MIAAGILTQKAVTLGLAPVQPWVQTSLVPGPKVVTEYLEKSALNKYLAQL